MGGRVLFVLAACVGRLFRLSAPLDEMNNNSRNCFIRNILKRFKFIFNSFNLIF
jgi:hypothetical protein